MLFLGRHDSHMRYLPPSRSTETSKQVPSEPPSTGFVSYLTHPPADSAAGCSVPAARSPASRQTSGDAAGTRRFMARPPLRCSIFPPIYGRHRKGTLGTRSRKLRFPSRRTRQALSRLLDRLPARRRLPPLTLLGPQRPLDRPDEAHREREEHADARHRDERQEDGHVQILLAVMVDEGGVAALHQPDDQRAEKTDAGDERRQVQPHAPFPVVRGDATAAALRLLALLRLSIFFLLLFVL